jgi:hypothetical protein
MMGWLDSSWLHVAAYLIAAAAALRAGVRERPQARANPNLWPTFWFLTAGLFFLMAIGWAGNLGTVAADLGRREAMAEGWYGHRRRYQALVIGSVVATWFVAIVVMLSRGPERRRRYLPTALISFTVVSFAVVRLVSLHQVDSLLYRREILGARVGDIVELALLAIAVGLTFREPRSAPPWPLVGADHGTGLSERQTMGQG